MELNDIVRDFVQRYEKSYIWVSPPDNNEESLFYVDRVTADRTKIANLTLTSPEFGKIILNMGTAHTLKFKYPPVGVFQYRQDAYMFRRNPAKQYRRGLCAGNSSIAAVYRDLTQAGDVDLSFDLLQSAYQAQSYSFADACRMLTSGKYRSVALKNQFSLLLPITPIADYLLMFWETPIASINPVDGRVVTIYEPSFEKVLPKVRSM